MTTPKYSSEATLIGIEGEATKSTATSAKSSSLDYGQMKIEDVYLLAREFVKAKDGGKAIQITYQDRNMMNALINQVHYGEYRDDKKQVGFLDLVGKDRLNLWKTLGTISKLDAMERYTNLLAQTCALFHPYLEAHQRNLEEIEMKRLKSLLDEENLKKIDMTEQKEKKLREEDMKSLDDGRKRREDSQRKQIQEALNQQTYPHFKAYSEQQHPNNIQSQEELIKQLQEQHFEQYMNQIYQQQLFHQQQQAEQLKAMKKSQRKNLSEHSTFNSSNTVLSHDALDLKLLEEPHQQGMISINLNNTSDMSQLVSSLTNTLNEKQAGNGASVEFETDLNGLTSKTSDTDKDDEDENDEENDEQIDLPPISAASMLTRKDVREFKDSVRKDNDAIIKVGSGETVTVRVPTHEDGRLIFWEFSTDYYDLGFGLYFEWTISPSNNVTVHVSDSSEEEDAVDETDPNKQDIEKGSKARAENKPPCDEIIPIFRRDCHEEVYAGSHLYPGRGVYLLKFDNSYSLWRSKTLYYRVYYSK